MLPIAQQLKLETYIQLKAPTLIQLYQHEPLKWFLTPWYLSLAI